MTSSTTSASPARLTTRNNAYLPDQARRQCGSRGGSRNHADARSAERARARHRAKAGANSSADAGRRACASRLAPMAQRSASCCPASGSTTKSRCCVTRDCPRSPACRRRPSSAARALNLADQIGSIEAGKAADFSVWTADPLTSHLRPTDLDLVVLGGAVHRPSALRRRGQHRCRSARMTR